MGENKILALDPEVLFLLFGKVPEERLSKKEALGLQDFTLLSIKQC